MLKLCPVILLTLPAPKAQNSMTETSGIQLPHTLESHGLQGTKEGPYNDLSTHPWHACIAQRQPTGIATAAPALLTTAHGVLSHVHLHKFPHKWGQRALAQCHCPVMTETWGIQRLRKMESVSQPSLGKFPRKQQGEGVGHQTLHSMLKLCPVILLTLPAPKAQNSMTETSGIQLPHTLESHGLQGTKEGPYNDLNTHPWHACIAQRQPTGIATVAPALLTTAHGLLSHVHLHKFPHKWGQRVLAQCRCPVTTETWGIQRLHKMDSGCQGKIEMANPHWSTPLRRSCIPKLHSSNSATAVLA